MNEFDDLQRAWQGQTSAAKKPGPGYLIESAKKNTRAIKVKHGWNIGILAVLLIFLFWFFGYAAGFRVSKASAGFILLILSILLRVVLEYASYRRFNTIGIDNSFTDYTTRITRFYRWRRIIHYVFTPVILLVYAGGFMLLLPVFKQQLSPGFYIYIVASGTVFFVLFTWFILKQVKKELRLLEFLQHI